MTGIQGPSLFGGGLAWFLWGPPITMIISLKEKSANGEQNYAAVHVLGDLLQGLTERQSKRPSQASFEKIGPTESARVLD